MRGNGASGCCCIWTTSVPVLWINAQVLVSPAVPGIRRVPTASGTRLAPIRYNNVRLGFRLAQAGGWSERGSPRSAVQPPLQTVDTRRDKSPGDLMSRRLARPRDDLPRRGYPVNHVRLLDSSMTTSALGRYSGETKRYPGCSHGRSVQHGFAG